MPDLTPIHAQPKKRVRNLEPLGRSESAGAGEGRALPPLKAMLSGPIFTRARDIIAANVNELLEKSADPAKMIRMIIMEMEDVLAETRATAARAIADLKEMRAAHGRLERMAGDWQDRAELALAKGREDLAKQALIERSRVDDMLGSLASEMAGIERVLKGYEADIQRLQSKLNEARARQASIASRIESAMSRARARELLYGERTEEAFARFDQLERRADMAEGHADAMGLGARSLEDEFAELKAEERALEALEEMKKARAARGAGDQGEPE
ncbi:PspA/IM30 family protein [Sphingomicrobium astaxanthinifaciens]|uniref:PspA/IM30 family protein n=1 Tax=Sphingomicrobium astaxanthinifaciens TaxID=1227949 RepID=UPI001FCB4F45|nr:PspA/IM30 family protein [Sphingomicrobium astaxanthinifaciens]MCJ7420757.1 PspA/IM30 family protein [Sphingomicrobium astaxanthinifaciens]